MNEIEDKIVQKAYETLVDNYARSVHRKKFDVIDRAFKFANEAHKGIQRYSGEPYILHPLAVALIASKELELGSTSISAALLHDVVEDTDYTIEDIKKLFGEKIAQIVEGLTKISGGNFSNKISIQAENMRRLLLTMSSDIRVILVKIADRLHNMRTLGSLPPAKQYKIAGETLYLYAPMSHRLGLFSIKTELEDLSFRHEYPEEYKQIEQQLISTAQDRERIYEQFTAPLKESLTQLGYYYKIQGRTKSIYSIWNKMQAKKINFSEIYDIFAVRIIFEPKPEQSVKKQCWDIYSIITDFYQLRPDRLRDWISHPKANGYQSLHLTVMGPSGQWMEVQIRSFQMNEIAERGFAAHWKYKEQKDNITSQQNELDIWLEKIQAILQSPTPNAMDFLDTIKLNLYNDEIFVFTPKGEIRTLPHGSAVLDFAYEIHSDVGHHCIGAKVNHTLVPISYKLVSGDQVEILTSDSQQPKKEWLNFIITATAKTKIESAIKKQRKFQIQEGKKLLTNYFAALNIEITIKVLDKFCAFYGYSKKELLYYALAEKQIKLPENPHSILKDKTNNFFSHYLKQALSIVLPLQETNKPFVNTLQNIDTKTTYILNEEEAQQNFITKSCCNPIPGDEVLGFIRDDGRLEVHKRLCQEILVFKTRFGNRIISCDWAGHKTSSFSATVGLKGIDRTGILSDIIQVITHNLTMDINKISLTAKNGVFKGIIEIFIHNVDDIYILSTELQKIKGVENVVRIDN